MGAEENGRRRAPRLPLMASGGPTEEERRERSEHLRRQRDALIAKRNADRERQVREMPARQGRQRARAV